MCIYEAKYVYMWLYIYVVNIFPLGNTMCLSSVITFLSFHWVYSAPSHGVANSVPKQGKYRK